MWLQSTWLKRFGALVGAVSAILGFVGFYLSVNSRIAVFPNEALDPKNPFTTSFILENQGLLRLSSVEFSTYFVEAKLTSPAGSIRLADGNFRNPAQRDVPRLSPGKRTTIGLQNPHSTIVLGGKPQTLDEGAIVESLVSYSPLMWLRQTEHFRFRLAYKTDGTAVWLPFSAD